MKHLRDLYHKLSGKVRQILGGVDYISLDETEKRLEQSLRNALYCYSDNIHLIKAQTALGKTTAYCKIAQNWRGKKPLMIAVPTTKLQNEVHRRLAEYGVHADMTPNVKGFLEKFGQPYLFWKNRALMIIADGIWWWLGRPTMYHLSIN